MKKVTKRILSLLLATVMICTIIPFAGLQLGASAVSYSANDAINALYSVKGTSIDYDGCYGAQCVDLISWYYNKLGVSPSSGNAYQYSTNALPSGWTRTAGGTPQKGDILVYAGGSKNGHVAIYESDYITWHQSWSGKYVQRLENRYYGSLSASDGATYWGCIHPDFISDDKIAPTIDTAYLSNVSATKFTINCTLNDNIGVTRVWLNIYGPNGSDGYAISASNGFFSHTIETNKYGGAGDFTVHIYAFDASNNQSCYAFNNIKAVDDNIAPTISNVYASGVSDKSFTINCDLNDNVGVTRVWLNIYGPNGSDGYAISASNGFFSHTVETSKYGGAGTYTVHIYAFDTTGNQTGYALKGISAIKDTIAPTISNVYASNLCDSSFIINCTLNDNDSVTRVWLNIYGPNGSDGYAINASNGFFSHTIETSKYGGAGTYTVHIYAFDTTGNQTGYALNNILAQTHTHSYTSKITTPATCTTNGVRTYSCSCGESYTEIIKATGHTDGEWVVTKPATYTETGTKTLYCATCKQPIRTEVIPKLTHGQVYGVEIDDVSLNYKSSTTIKPDINVDNGVEYTVKWESSNIKVATVDDNGKVTATKRGSGGATITCTVTDQYGNTVTDDCKVNVSLSFGQKLLVYVLFGWLWY